MSATSFHACVVNSSVFPPILLPSTSCYLSNFPPGDSVYSAGILSEKLRTSRSSSSALLVACGSKQIVQKRSTHRITAHLAAEGLPDPCNSRRQASGQGSAANLKKNTARIATGRPGTHCLSQVEPSTIINHKKVKCGRTNLSHPQSNNEQTTCSISEVQRSRPFESARAPTSSQVMRRAPSLVGLQPCALDDPCRWGGLSLHSKGVWDDRDPLEWNMSQFSRQCRSAWRTMCP